MDALKLMASGVIVKRPGDGLFVSRCHEVVCLHVSDLAWVALSPSLRAADNLSSPPLSALVVSQRRRLRCSSQRCVLCAE